MLKARSSHLKAYKNYLCGRERRARRCLATSITTADTYGLKFEATWAAESKSKWFGGTATTSITQAFEDIPFFVFT